jgi:alkylation response protein AidB-like acyl-CoA dehydrogenase
MFPLQVERYVRDLRVHTILEGPNEIMRVVMMKSQA